MADSTIQDQRHTDVPPTTIPPLKMDPIEAEKHQRRAEILFPSGSSKKNAISGNPQEITLEDCLEHYTSVEFLQDSNQFACEVCFKLLRNKDEVKKEEGGLNEDKKEEEEDEGENRKRATNVDQEGSQDDNNRDEDDEVVGETKDSFGNTHSPSPSSSSTQVPPVGFLKRDARKRCLLQDTPPLLLLHLKRFRQVGLRGRMQKSDMVVRFPLHLDLNPFSLPDPSSSKSLGSSRAYRLYGVVEHMGGLSGGHYIAWVRSSRCKPLDEDDITKETATSTEAPSEEEDMGWVRCSDAQVTPVSLEEVLNTAQAYLLFYERIN